MNTQIFNINYLLGNISLISNITWDQLFRIYLIYIDPKSIMWLNNKVNTIIRSQKNDLDK